MSWMYNFNFVTTKSYLGFKMNNYINVFVHRFLMNLEKNLIVICDINI